MDFGNFEISHNYVKNLTGEGERESKNLLSDQLTCYHADP